MSDGLTIFVILAVCATVFLILARPFRGGGAARPSAVPQSRSMAVSRSSADPRSPAEAALPAGVEAGPESVSSAAASRDASSGAPAEAPPPATEASAARARLLDEKDRLFQALADLRFDYEAGKLSREDYEDEDAHLRARAAAALHDLERQDTI